MTFTHVHRPLALGPATVKNRVFRSAHGTNLGQGTMSDDLVAYHAARARRRRADGLDAADNLRAARLLEGLGLIDFVNVSVGSYQSFSEK